MFHMRLTAMRYDDSAPFFWESTDAEVVKILNTIEEKNKELEHLYINVEKIPPKSKSDNYVINWYFKDKEAWVRYKTELEANNLDVFNKRNSYFEKNNHFLIASFLSEKGVEIYSTMVVPKS